MDQLSGMRLLKQDSQICYNCPRNTRKVVASSRRCFSGDIVMCSIGGLEDLVGCNFQDGDEVPCQLLRIGNRKPLIIKDLA